MYLKFYRQRLRQDGNEYWETAYPESKYSFSKCKKLPYISEEELEIQLKKTNMQI